VHSFSHLGSSRLLAHLRRLYIWQNMRSDCIAFVRGCESCGRTKANVDARSGLAAPLDLSPSAHLAPWARLHMDFTTSITVRGQPSVLLFVTVDSFTGFVCVSVMEASESGGIKAADSAAVFERDVLLRYGAPLVVVSDNGTEMAGEEWDSLQANYGFERRMCSSHRPEGNGRAERSVRWLKRCLSAMSDEAEGSTTLAGWRTRVARLVLMFNCGSEPAPEMSPFFLLHARMPRIQGDLQLFEAGEADLIADAARAPGDQSAPVPRFGNSPGARHFQRAADLSLAYSAVRDDRLERARAMQHRLNLDRHFVSFAVGDVVMAVNHQIKTHINKLERRFDGPYTVTGVSSSGLHVTLIRTPDGKFTRKRPSSRSVHVSALRHFRPYSDQASESAGAAV
jgi:transposase InsO family protein